MDGDQDPGQSTEVLRIADESLREGHAEQHQGEAHRPRGSPGHPQRDEEACGEAEEEKDCVRVEPGDRARVEPEPRLRVGIAGVGATARDDDPQHDNHERDPHEGPAEEAHLGANEPRHGMVAGLPGAHHEHDATGDDRDGHQEVRAHRPRTEAGEDGDAAEDRLDDRPDDGNRGQGEHRPA